MLWNSKNTHEEPGDPSWCQNAVTAWETALRNVAFCTDFLSSSISLKKFHSSVECVWWIRFNSVGSPSWRDAATSYILTPYWRSVYIYMYTWRIYSSSESYLIAVEVWTDLEWKLDQYLYKCLNRWELLIIEWI